MQILEISRSGLLKSQFPGLTHWIRWGDPLTVQHAEEPDGLGVSDLAGQLWRVRQKRFDLVVLPAIHPDHLYDQSPGKLIAKSLLHASAASGLAAKVLNTLVMRSTTHIVLDIRDENKLCETTRALFPGHALYFKRELDTSQTDARVRPLPLFVPYDGQSPPRGTKDIDVFFAGAICNPIREGAVRAAAVLASRGYSVFTPASPLTYRDYMAAMARSWLTLSPEGHGWDCYRHYEACFVGSVPVINLPRYPRTLYLREGNHCFYYDADKDDLPSRLALLLSDKARLEAVAKAGESLVRTLFTRTAVGRYVMDEVGKVLTRPTGVLPARPVYQ